MHKKSTTVHPLLEYSIPESVTKRIPRKFHGLFLKELEKVFGADTMAQPNIEYYLSGTYGWTDAFETACAAAKAKWLNKYRESLSVYNSDTFDFELYRISQSCIAAPTAI